MPATKNTPSTHHPRRRNVTTLMVGLKNGHIRKNLTQSGEPQRYSWGTQKKKKKKKKIMEEVKQRRWRWLGDTLRMNKTRHPHIAMRWTSRRKRRTRQANGLMEENVRDGDERSRQDMEDNQLARSSPKCLEKTCRCPMLQPERRVWIIISLVMCHRSGLGALH